VGTYNDAAGLGEACYRCPKAITQGETSCDACLPGKYKAATCVDCLAGQFTYEIDQTSCSNCPTGFHAKDLSKIKDEKRKRHDGCTGCPRGKYGTSEEAIDQAAGCTECIAGRFSELDAVSTAHISDSIFCSPCEAGKWNDQKGRTKESECSNCNTGKYSTTIASSLKSNCVDCSNGTYLEVVGADEELDCLTCPAGYVQETSGAAYCLPCTPGKHQHLKGKEKCTDCEIGRSTNINGNDQKECSLCPVGQKTSRTGSAECQNCGAGRYGDSCKECQLGQHRTSSLDDPTTCVKCSIGRYQSDTGQASCLPCTPGKHQHLEGKEKCTVCEIGKASSLAARDTEDCDVCKAGRHQPDNGTTTCLNCIPGRFQSTDGEADCIDCTVGRASSLVARDMDCDVCEAGRHQPDSTMTACLSCIPGKHQPKQEQAHCIICEKNTFAEASNEVSCKDCPSGKYTTSIGSASCQSCGAGSYGVGCKSCPVGFHRSAEDYDLSKCIQCKQGETTAKEKSASCSACDLGRYGDIQGVCSECGAGTYQDSKGELKCKNCPVDTYSDKKGKSSLADCSSCPVGRTTGVLYGATSELSCLCKKELFYQSHDNVCLDCPHGADCSYKDGIALAEVVAKVSFWRPNATGIVFSDCRQGYKGLSGDKLAAQRCCPIGKCHQNNTLNANNVTFDETDEQCADGYSGALCLVCAKDYVMTNGACNPCAGGSVFMNGIWALLIFSFTVYLGILVVLSCSVSQKRAQKGKRYFGQLKIILAFVQILASMPGVYDNVPWPRPFLEFTFPLDALNLDFLSFFSNAQCSLAVPFLERLVLHMALPSLLFIAVVSAYFTTKHCTSYPNSLKSQRKLARNRQVMYQTLILLILFLYPGLATRIFTVFRCRKIIGVNDGLVLEADFAIRCAQGEHLMATFLAVGGMFLFVLGAPLMMLVWLFQSRKYLHNAGEPETEQRKKHEHVKSSLGGLYLQYEPEYWWFEVVIIMHKMIMTGAMCVVAQGSSAQLLIAVLIMIVYMLTVLKTAPFVEDSEDVSSFIAVFTLTLTYIGGFALISEVNNRGDVESTYKTDTLAIMLVGLNVVCLIVELAIFLIIDVGGCVGDVMKAQKQLQQSNALNETPMFAGLDSEQLSTIIRTMTLRNFKKGDDLVIQGDAAYEWMAIVKGTADVLVNDELVTTFEKLSMLGEAALVADNIIHYRGATVRATSPVKALVLHRNEFLRLLKSGLLDHSIHEHAIERSKSYKDNDMKRTISRNLTTKVSIKNRTKVMPMMSHEELSKKTAENLRSIRKQFGAASSQYMRAAGRAQIARMTAPKQQQHMKVQVETKVKVNAQEEAASMNKHTKENSQRVQEDQKQYRAADSNSTDNTFKKKPTKGFMPPSLMSMDASNEVQTGKEAPVVAASPTIMFDKKMTWGRINEIRTKFGEKSPEYAAAMQCEIEDDDY